MNSAARCLPKFILAPFLYPCLHRGPTTSIRALPSTCRRNRQSTQRVYSTAGADDHPPRPPLSTTQFAPYPSSSLPPARQQHLDPPPFSYTLTPFTDRCTLTLSTGAGGHGCVSFLREKYIDAGPPNGGDGGAGGSVYIQAVRGETSLHRLARRGAVAAGRGSNGQGKARSGERGDDVVITVPVGTVVRELERCDPREEERNRLLDAGRGTGEEEATWRREKWILYPGATKRGDFVGDGPGGLPALPRRRESALVAMQPQRPIRLDLDEPMERPMLLAAGAIGGLGNPHFVTKNSVWPKFATKGESGMKITLALELKMLADVGLVGLPNAGKSTLLRALSNSRTRVGNWAFTTLQPNIGTVVLDNHKGRPSVRAWEKNGAPRTNFRVADIPGLIEDAHLDKGLGLGFLRHVERAAVLAFVIDLSAGDAVVALQALWREVGEYETLKNKELNAEKESRSGLEQLENMASGEHRSLPEVAPPITSKPWFVVATKADLDNTQANFANLRVYLELVKEGAVEHPSGRKNAWKKGAVAIPISAIRDEGVEAIPTLVVQLLDQ